MPGDGGDVPPNYDEHLASIKLGAEGPTLLQQQPPPPFHTRVQQGQQQQQSPANLQEPPAALPGLPRSPSQAWGEGKNNVYGRGNTFSDADPAHDATTRTASFMTNQTMLARMATSQNQGPLAHINTMNMNMNLLTASTPHTIHNVQSPNQIAPLHTLALPSHLNATAITPHSNSNTHGQVHTNTFNAFGGMQHGPVPVKQSWSDPVFSCFSNCPICILSCFLTPHRWKQTVVSAAVVNGDDCVIKIYWVMWSLATIVIVLNLFFVADENWLSTMTAFVVPVSFFSLMFIGASMRYQLREKFHISGSQCEDCLCHCLFGCCAIAQEARHVDRSLGLNV